MPDNQALTYFMDSIDRGRLRRVMDRLYDDRPLSGDDRRDLANALHAIMEGLVPYTDEPA